MSLDQDKINQLCHALLKLENTNQAYAFLKDLCTPNELNAMAERWQICKLLDQGLSYRDIQARMPVSLTTIGRVARFLKDEHFQGYRDVLNRLKSSE